MRLSEIWTPCGSALRWPWRASPSGFGPARGGGIVVAARIDPAGAFGAFLTLPERRVGLEVIHQELRRLERGLPVFRCRQHQHDIFSRRDPADAMNDR